MSGSESPLAVAPLASPRRPGHAFAASTLALLLGLQPVVTDMYLPALPTLTLEMHAGATAAQLTMAALILAFGVAQLAWGPLADRIGRKPVLLMGLALNVVASAGSALAQSIEAVIAWRIAQGIGLAAAVVCARAVIRDLYEPQEGGQVMSLALTGLGFIALSSPLLGGALASTYGWRGSMAAVGLFSAALLLFIAISWPETLATPNPRATRFVPMLRTWWRVAGNPRFNAWAALVSCSYGGLFTLLAGSSFVFIGALGASPVQYGAVLASCSVAYIVGTFICRHWIARHGLAGTVRRAAGFSWAGAAGLVLCAWLPEPGIAQLLPPIWLYMIGHGSHQPCGQTGAVAAFPREAGAASALAGFVLAALAFVTGLWLGHVIGGGVAPLALTIAFYGALSGALAWTLVARAERLAAAGTLSS